MKRFSAWLETRVGHDPQQMRHIMMGYLDLKFDPKKGMSISMDTLGPRMIHQMAEKIKNWTLLSDDQKQAALDVLYNKPVATLGDLADAIAGPRPIPAPEQPGSEGM